MVDAGRLAALLERVGSELVELTALAEMTAQDLRMDRFALPAAKYRLVVALEAAIDAAEHLIASEGLRASTSFADTFAVLGESGHLDGTLSEAMPRSSSSASGSACTGCSRGAGRPPRRSSPRSPAPPPSTCGRGSPRRRRAAT